MYIFPLVEWPICCGVVCILHVLGLRYYRLNCNYFYRYLAVCLSHLFTAVQNLSSQDSRPVDKSAREYPGAMVPFALTWISEGEQILSTDPPHVEWLHRFSLGQFWKCLPIQSGVPYDVCPSGNLWYLITITMMRHLGFKNIFIVMVIFNK